MELNIDALPVIWRFVPAFFMVLTVLAHLANEHCQQERLAKNFNIYTVHKRLHKRRI